MNRAIIINNFTVLFLMMGLTSFAQNVEFTQSEDETWLVDVEEAYELSKKSNKPILANFTGSDWCGWCKRLRAEVFDLPEFKQWAEENVILLELDFPRKKQLPIHQQQQNRGLQQAFQVTGFPTIWVFDLNKPANENKFQLQAYGKTGYLRGGVTNYTKVLDQMIAKKK
ncbi:MAG: thioredoxin family protein [Cyclobacteriaceae bacterium]|nr:thioredoxin family protein [Cyclobacteriaceae bacterium]